MQTRDFWYALPEELIAQHPLVSRADSRLLTAPAINRDSDHFPELFNLHVRDLAAALRAVVGERLNKGPCVLVVNDTRVYPARIPVRKETGAHGEVFVLSGVTEALQSREQGRGQILDVLLRPQKKLRPGDALFANTRASDCSAPVSFVADGQPVFEVVSISSEGCQVRCLLPLVSILECFGQMPLPPYIRRQGGFDQEADRERYQTVYARETGSAAAPTAGLHLTADLVDELTASGLIEVVPVTLHVGLGTFRPVQSDDPGGHRMHEERYMVPARSLERLIAAATEKRAIVYVGTTSFRAVESFFSHAMNGASLAPDALNLQDSWLDRGRLLADRWLSTDLFVYPTGERPVFSPWLGHAMMTNFHQPESTLMMLVSALGGVARIRQIYAHGVKERYRFLSYGDATLFGFASEQRIRFAEGIQA
jgi:S-adenosylmethionine:tRNA ribosyltransferase-isomerase